MSILVGDLDCGEDPSIFDSMADEADSYPESTGSVADVEKPPELVIPHKLESVKAYLQLSFID
ncbi:MAG: hypothetical protein DSY92_04690 [Planctomycetota bacterium]|nr:MAG: hypothetical protein DSY92_04690 [Planctomycetota bacterium]